MIIHFQLFVRQPQFLGGNLYFIKRLLHRLLRNYRDLIFRNAGNAGIGIAIVIIIVIVIVIIAVVRIGGHSQKSLQAS